MEIPKETQDMFNKMRACETGEFKNFTDAECFAWLLVAVEVAKEEVAKAESK